MMWGKYCGLQDPVKQLNRILEFVGLPTDWDLDQYVDDVKHYAALVKHVDPDEKEMRKMVEEAFKGPLEDLYRWFFVVGVWESKTAAQIDAVYSIVHIDAAMLS